MKSKRVIDHVLLSEIRSNPCTACGNKKNIVVHHVKTRKSGGNDSPDNCMSLCIVCHATMHTIGLDSFAKRNENIEAWLLQNGWSKMMGKRRKAWI